ncbi:MAG TPA: OadG family protein [Mesotoga infera]|jgi:sodium pump decarboxylase gamma subunit|uniref:Oxaloacetate decarboxylase, gamma chain n=1 Tax=Mesotoga infera TaxID=1236046 RepID=A0A7Z7LGN6_9BACT|nr:OadG family protein [Mesotoga infera]MBP8659880.1 OadG family protein [Mesotoga sp.]NLI05816.1 OadG family protein [Thermotogaceae bacterium]SSC13413.1 Oxaloacetate decarboxylase, gamma chain [Mesotoga infera]HNR79670.1 OadG family protein [Mesotoga infera]HNS66347.1 OadG family protein [Mesotoga infera]
MDQYLQITIIGIAVVFFTLAILYFIFNILGKLLSRDDKKKIMPRVVSPSPAADYGRIEERSSQDAEAVAAISAAILEIIGHENFQIKSLKPVPIALPSAWKRRDPVVYWRLRRSKN